MSINLKVGEKRFLIKEKLKLFLGLLDIVEEKVKDCLKVIS